LQSIPDERQRLGVRFLNQLAVAAGQAMAGALNRD
jgi:hypothetical protein